MQSFHKSLIAGSEHAFNSLASAAGSCPSFIHSSINYLAGRFGPQARMYMSVQKVTQSVTIKIKDMSLYLDVFNFLGYLQQ